MSKNVVIATDASPTRFGGWIEIKGKVVETFSSAITKLGESVVGESSESGSAFQQAAEARSMLVALAVEKQVVVVAGPAEYSF